MTGKSVCPWSPRKKKKLNGSVPDSMFCGPWEKRNMSTLGDAKPNAKIYIAYPYYLYLYMDT